MHFNESSYKNNGYFELGRLLSSTEVESIKSLFSSIENMELIPDSYQAVYEEVSDDKDAKKRLRKIRRLIWNEPELFSSILVDSGVIDLVERLLGKDSGITFHAAFLKPAKIGTPVGPHQDQALWSEEFTDALSVWTALTSVNPTNGGLGGYPASHKDAIPHKEDSEHPWHATVEYMKKELNEYHQFVLEPGDSVVWDRYFVHSSGPNKSYDDRQGVVAVFIRGKDSHKAKDYLSIEDIKGIAKGKILNGKTN